MNLDNKVVAVLGDSITEGACASKKENSFVDLLNSKYHLKTLNYGIGGTRISRQEDVSEWTIFDYDYNLRLTLIPKNIDVLIVFGGTNDFGHGKAPFEGNTEYSFKGALNILYDRIDEKYKGKEIVIITPLQREDQQLSLCGLPLIDYVNEIKRQAKNHNYHILDLYEDKDFKAGSKEFKENIFEDGLHPNDSGHALIAKKIYEYLKEIM